MKKKSNMNHFDDYDDIRKSRLTQKERDAIDEEARQELSALKAMQESLSMEIASFMSEEQIGIVELTSRLQTSTRQTSRIMKGEANITLATLAELAAVMGKIPKIIFEEPNKRKSSSGTKRKVAGRT